MEYVKEDFMFGLFKHFQLNKKKVSLLVLFIALQTLGTLFIPRLTADIINNGVVMGDSDYVIRTGAYMLGIAIATGISSILATYLTADITTVFARQIRRKLFSKIQVLSVQDFKSFHTSSLITRSTNDIEQVQSTLGMFFEMMLPVPFIAVIGMFLAYSRDPYMALIILIATLVFFLVIVLISKRVIVLSDQVQVALDKINGKVGQYISGVRVIRAFNRTTFEKKQMDHTFTDYANINIRINRTFALAWLFILLIMNLSVVAILWFGSHRINDGSMQIGDIMAVVEYTMIILFYLIMALMALLSLPRATACAHRIREVIEYEPEIVDGTDSLNNANESLSLEFRNVTFCYSDAENPVLHSLNFVAESGKTTAIIGGTGSGKSTIAKLIPRLHDVQGGEILLNGIDIKALRQQELRDHIGFVPQKSFLFSGNIEENIKHGKKDATLEEIKQAAKTAQADDFINNLEDGYGSFVSQGGSNFSGGQKQRLAIARALVKKPSIYVFDDSFSALDYKTDAALRSALKEETGDSIVVIVAQRISTIMDADQIIVLDEGEIVGTGTHQELLESCDVYKQIAESQLK